MTELQFAVLRRCLDARIVDWKGDAWEEQLVPIVGRLVHAAAVLLVGGVGITILAGLSDWASTIIWYPALLGYIPSPETRVFLLENRHLSKSLFAAIEIGLLCWVITSMRMSAAIDFIAAAFRNANAPFEQYARRVICEDTDGARAVPGGN